MQAHPIPPSKLCPRENFAWGFFEIEKITMLSSRMITKEEKI